MVLPAMFKSPDARETIASLRTVAARQRLPVMCYNNPVSYGVDHYAGTCFVSWPTRSNWSRSKSPRTMCAGSPT